MVDIKKLLKNFLSPYIPGQHFNSSPEPNHDSDDDREEDGFHSQPDLGESTVLVDSLERDMKDKRERETEVKEIIALSTLTLLTTNNFLRS